MDIGNNIMLLRKQKKWSQNDLAKRIGTSREIISKYEKEDVIPSVEIAEKIADAFEVSLDYLVGKGQNSKFDKITLKRLQEIHDLTPDIKEKLFFIIDTVLRDYKAKQAYT